MIEAAQPQRINSRDMDHPNAGLSGSDGHIARALDVDLPVQFKPRPAQMHVTRGMNDALHTLAGHSHGSRVAHIADSFFDGQTFQTAKVTGRPNQNPDLIARIEELTDDIVSYQPSRACNQIFHRLRPPLSAARWFRLSSTISLERINRKKSLTPLQG